MKTIILLHNHQVLVVVWEAAWEVGLVAVTREWEEVDALEVKVVVDRERCDPAARAVTGYDDGVWAACALEAKEARGRVSAFLRAFERECAALGVADAALAASIFHDRTLSVGQVKQAVAAAGIPVRPA